MATQNEYEEQSVGTEEDGSDHINEIVMTVMNSDMGAFLNVAKCYQKLQDRKLREKVKRKRKRTARPREADYYQTQWGIWLLDPASREHGTFEYKRFRTKFRIPCDCFTDVLVPAIIEHGIFSSKYESRIPLEIKCMIALRILGRGNSADDISEFCGVKPSTVYSIFKHFIEGVATKLFPVYVKPPEGKHLQRVMNTYARLGFPGAVGSIDCTHIHWRKCPNRLQNLCKGKETYKSVSFEVVVDHERRIHSCTNGFVGSAPDTVVVVNDAYVRTIAEGLYSSVEYSLYNEDGSFSTYRGGYLISDNGYTNRWIFMKPLTTAVDARSVAWSEFIESVRKDVECTFGILKSRFMFLALGVQYHHWDTLSHAMRTACVLHNMLLSWDRGANWDWDTDDMHPDAWDTDIGGAAADEPVLEAEAAGLAGSGLGLVPHTLNAVVVQGAMSQFFRLRSALLRHFTYAFTRGCLVWPKGFTASQRIDFNLPVRTECNVLYKAPSYLLCLSAPGVYDGDVGTGLFSTIAYKAGTHICRYQGVIKTHVQYEERVLQGQGGYAILVPHDRVLDCYDKRTTCYASMANCALHCQTRQALDRTLLPVGAPYREAVNNCRVAVHTREGGEIVVSLVSTVNIPPHRELLCAYANGYVYPNNNLFG